MDKPEKPIETLWVQRQGWGYLKRRDIWVELESSQEQLRDLGFVLRRPDSDDLVRCCPFCGMYICDVPGYLVQKHFSECGESAENWQAIEERLISDQRMKKYEAKMIAQKLQEIAELQEAEKRERFDRLKEEISMRQQQKDRKKRIRAETKEEWKKR